MKKQFVTYPIALALKELGFDKPCILGLSTLGVSRHKFTSPMTDDDYIRWDKYDTDLPIPLWQQVIDWFRTKHQILINPVVDVKDKFWWVIAIRINDYDVETVNVYGVDYYEAREAAILKAIEIVKGDKNG